MEEIAAARFGSNLSIAGRRFFVAFSTVAQHADKPQRAVSNLRSEPRSEELARIEDAGLRHAVHDNHNFIE